MASGEVLSSEPRAGVAASPENVAVVVLREMPGRIINTSATPVLAIGKSVDTGQMHDLAPLRGLSL